MSTTLSPTERARFLQALQDDPEFRDAVRGQLLSNELLELPERFAQFTAYVNTFIAHVNTFIEEQQAVNEEQRAFNARTDASIEELRGAVEELRELNRRADVNIGILKGNAARRLLRDHHETILEVLRLDFVRTLGRDDLTRLVRNSGVATQIDFGQRRSFYAADLVIEGIDDAGNTHYVAAEASFTADRRDTDRALRNAEFLTRFTGHPAHPIVASIANDRAVQELVDQRTIRWFQLDERELEAD